MTQWEPIDGNEIRVGDRITWGGGEVSFEVTDLRVNEWCGTNGKYVSNGKPWAGATPMWFSKYITKAKRVMVTTEYDPKQQPWDEGDI